MRHDAGATSLELDQDHAALRREWRFERVGWVGLALILAGAMAGLFGDGPLSARTAESGFGAVARYEGIVRSGASSRLDLLMPPSGDSLVMVAFDREYLDGVDVNHITPEPVEVRASRDAVGYLFRRYDLRAPTRVDFTITPTRIGRLRGRTVAGVGNIELSQFVLP